MINCFTANNPVSKYDKNGLVVVCMPVVSIKGFRQESRTEGIPYWTAWFLETVLMDGPESAGNSGIPFGIVRCVCRKEKQRIDEISYYRNWWNLSLCCDAANWCSPRGCWFQKSAAAQMLEDKTREQVILEWKEEVLPGGFVWNDVQAETMCVGICSGHRD